MPPSRIWIAVAVPLLALVARLFLVPIISYYRRETHGIPIAEIKIDRHLRLLGWDFANVSVGLLVAATTLTTSSLYHLAARPDFVKYLCFVGVPAFYASLYGWAAYVRYAILEAVEQEPWASNRPEARQLAASRVWFCAAVLFAFTAGLAVESKFFGIP